MGFRCRNPFADRVQQLLALSLVPAARSFWAFLGATGPTEGDDAGGTRLFANVFALVAFFSPARNEYALNATDSLEI